MLGSSRPMAFVATTDAARARRFYEDTLGLAFVGDDPFGMFFDSSGVSLRVSTLETLTPAPYTVLGWTVTDIKATIDGLTAKGVAFERFPGFDQDDDGIWTPPGGARVAWFKDPDGNLLSLTELG